jgi:hypothetical protein
MLYNETPLKKGFFMITVINNPITRFAVKAIVTYAYVHMALDIVQGSIKVASIAKTRISR